MVNVHDPCPQLTERMGHGQKSAAVLGRTDTQTSALTGCRILHEAMGTTRTQEVLPKQKEKLCSCEGAGALDKAAQRGYGVIFFGESPNPSRHDPLGDPVLARRLD